MELLYGFASFPKLQELLVSKHIAEKTRLQGSF